MKTLDLFLNNVLFKHPFAYLFSVIMLTLIIRILLNLFKAWAIKNREIDDKDGGEDKWSKKPFKYIFCASIFSSSKDYRVDDCWLPFLIGMFELTIFPVLIKNSLWVFLGAWIGIKTASSWGGWQKTRTAYNRFLLGNILSLSASYLLTVIFFKY